MIKVNEYFDGKVKSMALQTDNLPATIGVMTAGEYTFGTDCKELMSVVNGELKVKLPDEGDWQTFTNGQSFEVPANIKFDVVASRDTAYFCQYWR